MDRDVEKGFNPMFMADGTLMAVYNKVTLEYVSKEVEINGQMVTIENVPEAGRNDLYMLTYQFHKFSPYLICHVFWNKPLFLKCQLIL